MREHDIDSFQVLPGVAREYPWVFDVLQQRATSSLLMVADANTRQEIIIKWRTIDAFGGWATEVDMAVPLDAHAAFAAMLLAREVEAAYDYAKSIKNAGRWDGR